MKVRLAADYKVTITLLNHNEIACVQFLFGGMKSFNFDGGTLTDIDNADPDWVC